MRGKLIAAATLLAGVLAFGGLTSSVSAHPPGVYDEYYYGNGAHDFVPHWHFYNTPSGTYGYYGLGGHDFAPHGHYSREYVPPHRDYYPAPYGYSSPYSYGYPGSDRYPPGYPAPYGYGR
jgi:hypothetical protein